MINTPLQSNYNNAVKYLSIVLLFLSFSCNQIETTKTSKKAQFITALNSQEIPTGDKTYAIVGVSLIDGISDTPFRNASVIVHNGIISEVETKDSFQIPEGAQIIDGEGLTLLPGLIDAHYHNSKGYPAIYLKKGITSLRDPGIWIEDYDLERQSGKPLPRLFLTGPHLDMPPPTYPNDAYVVR
ncbi:MAG: hypothetical protein ACI9J3_002502, partial [Parvicellaceae bacterium]